ncbi:TetR/AcrR family transcriptional regulator C-terminal domain-containing protein [Azospirillum agricola]|uniref:TetR/AcrR family transcriptional regulator C-terminal domain-containing protein n=1 Tax=Azospirillum agricola TaxID=1720247 RepID=UPI000A0EF9F0|nr:TetR/AcrR family transcriptional regulator C-terminal domain-containing protein [Azospirillum agricola]SMH44429.1 transcriptional regulator, TetR family [Azospirillum lipoferum]
MKVQRRDVIDTALALLDEVGLEGLTMRRLAQALGIQAPSLYWHFPNKQALLDAMADAMLDGVALPDDALPWDAWLRAALIEFRRALKARRDGARVFAGTFLVTENVLRIGDRAVGRLLAAGADERTAVRALFTLQYFALGFTIEEQAAAPASESVDLSALAQRITQDQTARYPYGAAVATVLASDDDGERFRFGLDRLIDGLRAVIPAG